jgi:SH3-like domain-containing protein
MKKRFLTISPAVRRNAATLACVLALLAPALPARAADAVGPVTGLPLPRFASLKSDRVNLREGPSKDHRTTWVFQRAGLPVEIMAEFETWRRIRDAEGTEGWVLHSLLSGRRTALVSPWLRGEKAQPVAIFDRADDRGGIVARLSPGVLGNVRSCDGSWCRIGGQGGASTEYDGYIRQDRLWGAYPNEKID